MPDEHTVSEVIVIGTRKRPSSGFDTPRETDDQPTNENGGESGGEGTVTWEQAKAEDGRLKECAAQTFETRLEQEQEFARDQREFFSFGFNKGGTVTTHPPRGGAGAVIQPSDRAQARADFGFSRSDVMSFNHNHPERVYCDADRRTDRDGYNDQLLANGYPSLADWAAADEMVGPLNGEPGANASTFTLFVTGCNGVTRAFPYSEKARFIADMQARRDPPDPIAPTGCPSV